MELKVLATLTQAVKAGKSAALVILEKNDGSTPGIDGAIMLVLKDGSSIGTIGGGKLEYKIIEDVKNGFSKSEHFNFEYSLEKGQELKMVCGGNVRGYVRYFKEREKLFVFGAGHVGQALVRIAKTLDFHINIIDYRRELLDNEVFKDVTKWECSPKDIRENLRFDSNSYIAIMTPKHEDDYNVLKEVIEQEYKYLGLMGSRNKTDDIYKKLKDEGVAEKNIKRMFMPIGLDVATGTPEEIAISILGEILSIKNGGSGKHLSLMQDF